MVLSRNYVHVLKFNVSLSITFEDGYENHLHVKGRETRSCIYVHTQLLTLSSPPNCARGRLYLR